MRVCATVAVLSGACSAFSRTLGPRAAISRCSVAEPAEAAAADAAVAEKEPLLLRMARGEKVERAPVWMMRQAGRHMQVYRDLVKKYPTFRERSEIPEVLYAAFLRVVSFFSETCQSCVVVVVMWNTHHGVCVCFRRRAPTKYRVSRFAADLPPPMYIGFCAGPCEVPAGRLLVEQEGLCRISACLTDS